MTFVWSTKLAHENKSFSSPPLNVWFPVAVQQITWYRSRSGYWLLIEGSIKAHWLMTLYGLNWKWYTQTFSERRRCSFYTPFSFRKWTSTRAKRARERDPLALMAGAHQMVNKSRAVFIFILEIDDLQRENRSTNLLRKSRGTMNRLRRCLLLFYWTLQEVSGDYANVMKSLLSLFKFS